MALTDTAVRHAKPRAKDYTLPTTTASPFSLIRKAPKKRLFSIESGTQR